MLRTSSTLICLAAILLGFGCSQQPGPSSPQTADTLPSTQPEPPSSKIEVTRKRGVTEKELKFRPLTLLQARQGFTTNLIKPAKEGPGAAEPPPPRVFQIVRYSSSVGPLVAYLTPDPGDGKQHPAVLWAHGGFGGIGDYFWEERPDPENDQSARAFRTAGLVLMCPSWRGENDNPGRFEMFYGELDDLLAAIKYLSRVPYVDPQRIYLAGHSTGGTMTLLGAVSQAKVRAAFSFGGAPDVGRVVADGKGYGNTPFDHRSRPECRLRSATYYAGAIECPTFYFEGFHSSYCPEAQAMERRAKQDGAPFRAFTIRNANHFNILDPITRLVAGKIQQDTGSTCNITFTDQEVQQAFDRRKGG